MAVSSKKNQRQRRASKGRARVRDSGRARLCVHRTPRHIYAQIISADGASVLATSSTLEKDMRGDLKYTGNVDAAAAVGKAIAERASSAGVTDVAFDRSGFRYHGRVKALADAARENGLNF